MPIHQIPKHGMGVGTTYKSARDAATLGLVRIYYCGTSRCAELTEKGRLIAEKLVEILGVLEALNLVEPLAR